MYDDNMDKECIPLCDAINRIPGLETVESCCGHGNSEFRIWFDVNSSDWLPVLLYYCDVCHMGFQWDCSVTTDCGMSPVVYLVSSRCKGKRSYREAQDIADSINGFMDSKSDVKNYEDKIKYHKEQGAEW